MFTMIKFVRTLIVSITIFSFIILPSHAQNKENTSSSQITEKIDPYVLFWPLVAGNLPSDPFYFLKTFKENLSEVFMFNNAKKGENQLTLATKRLLEAEKLAKDGKKDLANLTLEKVSNHVKNSENYLFDAKNNDAKSYSNVYQEVKNKSSNINRYLPQLKKDLGEDYDKSVELILSSILSLQNKLQ